ncbi:ABC transporter permease [Sporolactobacillus shoreicorticis]|uniref:ABC transporter permease n=1 Tax=Sporolactobacillus shoreicorticis TaxID=1923877 RepID=A0ABW5S5M1_9BACL|nr:ABC transporter permease [Sporolactobacillus shoreicorticis]MCO7126697.1 ABC transporter permease [Sporolactobacillus shoreicorticis]
MPVFKLCMKIIRKNWLSISLYIVIFLAIAITISMSTMSEQKKSSSFSQEKAKIALISEEKTPLTEGFRQELAKSSDFVKLPDRTEALQDALFFRNVTYILRIPKGFTEDVLSGGSMQMEKTVVPNSTENAYVDINVNQYWNLARIYAKHEPGASQQQLVKQLKTNLSGSTPVTIRAHERAITSNSFSMYYFNFLAYALSAVLIMGISTVMIVVNKRDLSRRNFCSPLKASSINAQLILANLLFATASWVILVVFCFFLDSKSFATQNMTFFLINSAIFTACVASLSYLIGNLMKNLNAMSAVCNVLTLGPCFISGVFVPQEFLNDTVLKIASFTPTYWYVQANARIAKLTQFGWSDLSSIIYSMAILLVFAVAFAALSLVIGKRRRLTN